MHTILCHCTASVCVCVSLIVTLILHDICCWHCCCFIFFSFDFIFIFINFYRIDYDCVSFAYVTYVRFLSHFTKQEKKNCFGCVWVCLSPFTYIRYTLLCNLRLLFFFLSFRRIIYYRFCSRACSSSRRSNTNRTIYKQ